MNTNEKLKQIFHREDFRQDDIVYAKYLKHEYSILYKVLDDDRYYLIDKKTQNQRITHQDNLTLKIPKVILSDVLVKMGENKKYDSVYLKDYAIDADGTMRFELGVKVFGNKDCCDWKLQDKDGINLDLWQQSEECRCQIAEVLCQGQ